jgi:cbb3-type cytochrome oxidase maturation protein
MEALYLLIPLSVIAVFGIIWVLWRAVDGGQFEDLDGPAHAILLDDDRPRAAPLPSADASQNQGEQKSI